MEVMVIAVVVIDVCVGGERKQGKRRGQGDYGTFGRSKGLACLLATLNRCDQLVKEVNTSLHLQWACQCVQSIFGRVENTYPVQLTRHFWLLVS